MNNPLIRERIRGIDTVRGLIMILMTLDHSRDFLHFPGPSPTNMETTTVVLFFTRWITHFCAPTFVLLSGVSASLAGLKRTKAELAEFLFKRGLWLIVTDLVVITLLFTFDWQFHLLVLEVLWAIGFGMMLLGMLIQFGVRPIAIGVIGLALVFGHNLFDNVPASQGFVGDLQTLLLTGRGAIIPLEGNRALGLLYPALPWGGILLMGYWLGLLYGPGFDAGRRRRLLLMMGAGFIVLFVVLRLMNGYGDPAPWSKQRNAAHTLLSFLNTSKQPPSLLFVSMTIGPVLVLLALADRVQTAFTKFCAVYGNVPYFYFIVHLCLLRLMNLGMIAASGIGFHSDGNILVWQAKGFGYPLWACYGYWFFVVALLYLPCKWYGNYKKTNPHWWLSYL
jgi:uncharacterized membrane protein